MSSDIELDTTVDEPNWDLEIPLVMGAVERGALAHRIRAWGAQQFATGKAAAVAELRPLWLAEKERADRLQAGRNEAAFDKLLGDSVGDSVADRVAEQRKRVQERFANRPPSPPTADFDLPAASDPAPCRHEFEIDQAGSNYSIWRCRHCGTERRR